MSFPINPIFLFSDSQLLFHPDGQGKLALAEVVQAQESEDLKAAYIGASNGDDPMFFSIFEAAMDLVKIKDRRMIFADYNEEDRTYLQEANLILLAGGDVDKGWQAIQEMQQDIIQRYYAGAILVGVSAGAVQLGLGGWHRDMPQGHGDLFDTFKLIPFYVDAHDEDNNWERLKAIIGNTEAAIKGLGIPKGGGLIYHPDHTIEPLRQSLVEFSGEKEEVNQTLLLPGIPPESAEDDSED